MQIEVIENVTKLNDDLAKLNRDALHAAKVFTINVIGAVGSGKTALIESLVPQLGLRGLRCGVIVGDLATQRDAERIARATPTVVQINTGRTCHLEANHVRQAMQRIDLNQIDLLLIENVGNLICPVSFDLGHDVQVCVFSAMHGDDKPAKHPPAVASAHAIVVTASDMIPHVRFDRTRFDADVDQWNSTAPTFYVANFTGEGIDALAEWIDIARSRAANG
jgi:hydrogenase nickel incorporation protein HypB